MKKKKFHLKNGSGSRSRCRYSARPSRHVLVLSDQDFLALPAEYRCAECVDIGRKRGLFTQLVHVQHILPGEEVVCEACSAINNGRLLSYGEAFLTGPDHSPHDGQCHHFCRAHLDAEAVLPEDDTQKKGHRLMP